ncbi:Nucleoprotein TPR [Trichoplax sp. H2]|nr:Nucleoprotein TPR [Trichoplax sp. H2]|eukprot:RDD46225.1 Nucleoprotein TPR [Trichoplax sp. H2]
MTDVKSVIQLNQEELDTFIQQSQLARKVISNIEFYIQNQERKNQLWLNEKEHLQAENERTSFNAENRLHEIEHELLASRAKIEKQEKYNDQLSKDIEDNGNTLNDKNDQIRQLQTRIDQFVNNESDHNRLVEKLNEEKNDLLDIINNRDKTISQLQDELEKLVEKLSDTNSNTATSKARIDELESTETTWKLREQRLEQEKQLISSHGEWLKAQNEKIMEEFNIYRKEKSSELLIVTNELESLRLEAEHLRSSKTLLEKSGDDQQNKIDTLLGKLKEVQDERNTFEGQITSELSSQRKLADLYKTASEASEFRVQELAKAVEELHDQLKNTQISLAESESHNEELIKSLESKTKLLEDTVQKQQNELNNANDLLSAARSRDDSDTTAGIMSKISPTAAATGAFMKSGMTLTEIYTKYVETAEALQLEKDETTRLKQYLNQILAEIEERAPLLYQQKKNYEESLLSIESLKSKLNDAVKENGNLRENIEEVLAISEELKSENKRLKAQIIDLSQQVQTLLKESIAKDSSMQVTLIEDNLQDTEVSSSSAVISGHLVIFRQVYLSNIEELQAQNQKLLAVVRDLSKKLEEKEEQIESDSRKELRSRLEDALKRVQDMEQTRLQQLQITEAITRQRDMYKVLQERDTPNKSQESMEKSTTIDKEDSSSHLNALLELQEEFKKYKENKEKNDKYTNNLLLIISSHLKILLTTKMGFCTFSRIIGDQMENFRKEASEFRMENNKLKSDILYSAEKLQMTVSQIDVYKKEIEHVRESSQRYSSSLQKMQVADEAQRQQLSTLRERYARLEAESQSLERERDLYKSSENRLLLQNQSLLQDQKTKGLLLANLQAIQNNFESSEYEIKSKLKNQIETLQSEISTLKDKLNVEKSDFLSRAEFFEAQITNLRKDLDTERQNYRNTKEKLTLAEYQVNTLNEQNEQIKNQLKASESRLDTYLRHGRDGNDTDNAEESQPNEDRDNSRQLMFELQKELARSRGLEEQLIQAKSHIEQYKAIAAANEDALKDVNQVSNEFKKAMEEELQGYKSREIEMKDQLKTMEDEIQNLKKSCSELETSVDAKNEELQKNLQSAEEKLQTTLEELNAAKKSEQNALNDYKAQTELATEAQDKYEREMILHAANVKELIAVKEQLRELQGKVSLSEETARIAEETLQTNTNSYEEQLRIQKQDIEQLENRYKEIDEQNAILHRQIEEISSRTLASHGQVSSFDGSTSDSFSNSDKSSDELLEVIRFIRREKNIAETKYEVTMTENLRLKSRCDYLERQLEEARSDLLTERNRIKSQIESAAKYTNLMEKVENLNLLNESNRLLRDEKEKLEQQVKQQTAKISQLEKDIQPLRDSNRTLKVEKDTLLAEKAAMGKEIEQWVKRSNQLLEQRADREEMKQLTDRIDALKKENENLKEEFQKNNAKVSSLVTTANSARSQLNAAKSDIAKKDESIKTLETEIASKNNDISEKGKTIAQVRKLARRYKTQYEELKKEVDEKQTKGDEGISQTTAELSAIKEELSKKNTSLTEKDEEINKLKNELSKNASSVSSKDDERKKLQEQITTLENVKNTVEEKYRRLLRGLQTKTKEFNSTKETLNSEIDQLKTERSSDKDKISSLEENIVELKMRLGVLKSQYDGKIGKLKQQIQQQALNESTPSQKGTNDAEEQKVEDAQRTVIREAPKCPPTTTEQSKQIQTSDKSDSNIRASTTLKVSKEQSQTETGTNEKTAVKPQVRPQIKRILGNQKASVSETMNASQGLSSSLPVKRNLPPSNADRASKRVVMDKREDGTPKDKSSSSVQVMISNSSVKKSAFVNPAALDIARAPIASTSAAEAVPVSSSNNSLKTGESRAKAMQTVSINVSVKTQEPLNTTNINESTAYSDDNAKSESHEQSISEELHSKNVAQTNLKRTRTNEPQTTDIATTEVETDETPNSKKQKIDDSEPKETIDTDSAVTGEQSSEVTQESTQEISTGSEDLSGEQPKASDAVVIAEDSSHEIEEGEILESDQPISSESQDQNIGREENDIEVSNVTSRSRRQTPFTPIHFASMQHPSGTYDESDDCRVPSTPTLLIPRPSETFAEAVSSPNTQRDEFSFAQSEQYPSVPDIQPSALEDVVSHTSAGLCVDDTRIDLSAETSNSDIRKTTDEEIFLAQPDVPTALLSVDDGNVFDIIDEAVATHGDEELIVRPCEEVISDTMDMTVDIDNAVSQSCSVPAQSVDEAYHHDVDFADEENRDLLHKPVSEEVTTNYTVSPDNVVVIEDNDSGDDGTNTPHEIVENQESVATAISDLPDSPERSEQSTEDDRPISMDSSSAATTSTVPESTSVVTTTTAASQPARTTSFAGRGRRMLRRIPPSE